jgi:hypothetical protein
MYSILQDAGQGGLTADQWNDRLREVGIGVNRKADIYDNRRSLQSKGWSANSTDAGQHHYEDWDYRWDTCGYGQYGF